jgi:hypothetical protein
LVESKAWAMYRERRKQFASLIGDREPIALKRQLPGMGRAMRYIITIADDDRRLLQNLVPQTERHRRRMRRDAQQIRVGLDSSFPPYTSRSVLVADGRLTQCKPLAANDLP